LQTKGGRELVSAVVRTTSDGLSVMLTSEDLLQGESWLVVSDRHSTAKVLKIQQNSAEK
jgi:hypothetical protein